MAKTKPPETILLAHCSTTIYSSVEQALSSLATGGTTMISEYRLVKTTAYRKRAVVEEIPLPEPEPQPTEPPMEIIPTRVRLDDNNDIPF